MFDIKSLLLIRNEAKSESGRLQQKIICAYIDGYTDAQAELNKLINKLWREKDERASIMSKTTEELRHNMDTKYNELCKLLNEVK